MTLRVPRGVSTVAALAVLALAAYSVAHSLQAVSLAHVARALRGLSASQLAASAAWTAASFACLGTLEAIASRHAGVGDIRPIQAWRNGATAHALCNTLGFHAVLAPALRLSLYRPHRLGASGLARLLAVVATGIASGVGIVAAIAAAMCAGGWAGGASAGVLIAIMLGCASRWAHAGAPSRRMASWLRAMPRAAAVGTVECACAITALYVLLPADERVAWPAFVLAYIAAGIAGIVSHAPGGIGVFEGAMLAVLPGDRADLLAALVAYRLLYNLVPAAIAAVVFAVAALEADPAVSSTADNEQSVAAVRHTASPAATGRWVGGRADGSRR